MSRFFEFRIIFYDVQRKISGCIHDRSVGSDIQEGKLTLLVAYALEQGTHGQQEELRHILSLGTGLGFDDVERFRLLLIETGSLEQAREMAKRYIREGKQALGEVQGFLPSRSFDFFEAIADYMSEREY